MFDRCQGAFKDGRVGVEGGGGEGDVLGDGEGLPQAQALGDVAEAAAGGAVGGAAEGFDCAVGGDSQTQQDADEGGLAGPVGAEQADDLAGADIHGDAVDGGECPIALTDVVGADEDGAHVRTLSAAGRRG